MKRLTIRTPKGAALKMNDTYQSEAEAKDDLMRKYRIAIERLADYEDMGLTPEEVAELVKRTTRVKPYAESDADRLCGHCYSYIDWDALNGRVEDAPKYCKSCGKPIDWSDKKGGAE